MALRIIINAISDKCAKMWTILIQETKTIYTIRRMYHSHKIEFIKVVYLYLINYQVDFSLNIMKSYSENK